MFGSIGIWSCPPYSWWSWHHSGNTYWSAPESYTWGSSQQVIQYHPRECEKTHRWIKSKSWRVNEASNENGRRIKTMWWRVKKASEHADDPNINPNPNPNPNHNPVPACFNILAPRMGIVPLALAQFKGTWLNGSPPWLKEIIFMTTRSSLNAFPSSGLSGYAEARLQCKLVIATHAEHNLVREQQSWQFMIDCGMV
jgi:hypothetical protein